MDYGHDKYMVWTVEDTEFLTDHAGYLNHEELSEKLGKSVAVIKKYQTRHHIRFLDNVYTYTLLAKELGCARNTIKYYYNKGWLKGQKANWKWGESPIIFKEEDIVQFLKKYPQALANRVFPNLFFRGIRNG